MKRNFFPRHYYPLLFCIVAFLAMRCSSPESTDAKNTSVDSAPKPHEVSPQAKALNDSACHLMQKNPNDTASFKSALNLFDQAVKIDTAYYMAFSNRRGCQYFLGDYPGMLESSKHMLQLHPDSPELLGMVGIDYERNNDKEKANASYQQSLDLSNKMLDTMKHTSRDWMGTQMNKGCVLVLLNRPADADMVYDEAAAAAKDTNMRNAILRYKGMPRENLIDRGKKK